MKKVEKSIGTDGSVIYITPERSKEFHQLCVDEIKKEINKEIIKILYDHRNLPN
jgi:hypothetical protein